jgi:hypothetical protein
MFLIANEASDGIFGFLLIISSDKSFIESIVALNFEFAFPGFSSGIILYIRCNVGRF